MDTGPFGTVPLPPDELLRNLLYSYIQWQFMFELSAETTFFLRSQTVLMLIYITAYLEIKVLIVMHLSVRFALVDKNTFINYYKE